MRYLILVLISIGNPPHSLITGLTLGLEKEATGVWVTFAAISSHKFVIAFSVGVELVTSKVILIFEFKGMLF